MNYFTVPPLMGSSIFEWSGKSLYVFFCSLSKLRSLSCQMLEPRALMLIATLPYRSEAKGVPNLLVASQPPQTHNSTKTEVNDGHTEDPDGGYYSDGAYTAAPAANLQGSSSASVAPKAQDLYYESLLMRFNLLRATMRCSPPLSAIKQLDSSHPISLPDSRKAKQNWRLSLQTTRPEMVQVACIDAESVLRIVKVLSGILGQVTRSRDTDRIRRVGAWVWAMLGKCKDRTELGSEEIAELRELGKEAGALLVNIQDHTKHPVRTIMIEDDEELTRELASVDGVGESTDVKVEENQQHGFLTDERLAGVDLDEAKKRLQGVLDMSEDATNGLTAATEGELLVRRTEIAELDLRVDEQVNTTLDMIITVVGDVYGQRDLLKFRRIWNEDVDV